MANLNILLLHGLLSANLKQKQVFYWYFKCSLKQITPTFLHQFTPIDKLSPPLLVQQNGRILGRTFDLGRRQEDGQTWATSFCLRQIPSTIHFQSTSSMPLSTNLFSWPPNGLTLFNQSKVNKISLNNNAKIWLTNCFTFLHSLQLLGLFAVTFAGDN